MLNVSSQAVSKWETEIANPDLLLIPDLAKLFGISVDELLGVEKENNEVSLIYAETFNRRLDRLEKLIGLLAAKDDNEALCIMLDDAKKAVSFNFTETEDFEKTDWKLDCAKLVEGKKRLVFRAVPVERVVGKMIDPMVVNEKIKMNINNIRKILVTLRSDMRAALLKVYFITEENPVWSERNCFCIRYSSEVHTINIDTSMNNMWYGTLKGIRIDPVENNRCGVVELMYIALVDGNGEVVYAYDFIDTRLFDKSDWEVSYADILESNNSLKLNVYPFDRKVLTYDPMVENDNVRIDVSMAKYVHVRLKTILENNPNHRGWYRNNVYYDANLRVYFKTEYSNEYSQDKCVESLYGSGAMTDVYVDMSKNSLWNGTLTGLRIDPVDALCGTFEIELVEILMTDKTVGVGGMLKGIEKRLADIEDRLDSLECMCSEIESRLDDLEE